VQALGYGRIAKYGNTGVEWHSAFIFAFETTKRGNDEYTEHEVFRVILHATACSA
jgi:hypothetical protein